MATLQELAEKHGGNYQKDGVSEFFTITDVTGTLEFGLRPGQLDYTVIIQPTTQVLSNYISKLKAMKSQIAKDLAQRFKDGKAEFMPFDDESFEMYLDLHKKVATRIAKSL